MVRFSTGKCVNSIYLKLIQKIELCELCNLSNLSVDL